jgi:hypothetical protein
VTDRQHPRVSRPHWWSLLRPALLLVALAALTVTSNYRLRGHPLRSLQARWAVTEEQVRLGTREAWVNVRRVRNVRGHVQVTTRKVPPLHRYVSLMLRGLEYPVWSISGGRMAFACWGEDASIAALQEAEQDELFRLFYRLTDFAGDDTELSPRYARIDAGRMDTMRTTLDQHGGSLGVTWWSPLSDPPVWSLRLLRLRPTVPDSALRRRELHLGPVLATLPETPYDRDPGWYMDTAPNYTTMACSLTDDARAVAFVHHGSVWLLRLREPLPQIIPEAEGRPAKE